MRDYIPDTVTWTAKLSQQWRPPDLVDLDDLLRNEPDEPDWLVEQFWPSQAAMAVWAIAKQGKSEFVLHCVVGIAQGVDPLSGEPCEPKRVLYIDQEMGKRDLRKRLQNMGHTTGEGLENLKYAQQVKLPGLDTPDGAAWMEQCLDHFNPDCVVIDTVARVIDGEENSADSYRMFARHTGQLLKSRGIGYIRVDHGGKDADKGQRGSSAKNDDPDVIWQLARGKDTDVKLKAVARDGDVPDEINLVRTDDPFVTYQLADLAGEYTTNQLRIAKLIRAHNIPPDWGRVKVTQALQAAGETPGKTTDISAAIKYVRRYPK